jgi:hypothetical protein
MKLLSYYVFIFNQCSNDTFYYTTYQIRYVSGSLNHLRSSVGSWPRRYKMRITIAPKQPAKNTKPKTNISKYNANLMNREKIHDTKLHATSQMAFRPILLSRVKFGAYKGNKIYISIMLRIVEEKKIAFWFFVTLFINYY